MGIQYPLGGVLHEESGGKAVVFDYELYAKRILITGANGQLGNEMRLLADKFPEFTFDFTDIGELDLCNEEAVLEYCTGTRPSYIINCAAYTAVDKAEDDIDLCTKINRDAVSNIAKAAKAVNAKILHVSTDYVFDGTNHSPYVESDPVCPASVYGKTKLEGEQVLMAICPESVILRTAWLYSIFGNNFVKTMIKLGKEREKLTVIFDQIGTPTYAADLASALMQIVKSAEKGSFVPGIFHFSDEGVCSWYDFTVSIHKLAGITTCQVLPIETKDYPAKAARPAYSVLNKSKIKAVYGITIPHWETSLAACIAKL
ncbi:MAG: dTDP-4-dehydrorhamnose reductase [Bacteroidales bacterium]|nr:dTDP-4-dehydrorhamnose reductase [Bacteroidales bacterium]